MASDLLVKAPDHGQVETDDNCQIRLGAGCDGDPGLHGQIVTDNQCVARAQLCDLIANSRNFGALQDQTDHRIVNHGVK